MSNSRSKASTQNGMSALTSRPKGCNSAFQYTVWSGTQTAGSRTGEPSTAVSAAVT